MSTAPVQPTPLARCLFATALAAGLFGVALGALAAGEGSGRLLACSILGITAALLLRHHLRRIGQWQACADEDDRPDAVPSRPGADRLSRLEAELAALEALRGTSRFNPWELQAARRRLGFERKLN